MGAFDAFSDIAPDTSSPWRNGTYHASLTQLEMLLGRCIARGSWSEAQGGAVGAALDLWVARELRRAGYEIDAVWPRETDPRVLPASVARAMNRLSATDRNSAAAQRITSNAGSAGPSVFGEFFAKSVDVLVADWDRGVEIMVSTKGMTASFGKNLTNRWEEFAGDLRNIRGRFRLPSWASHICLMPRFSVPRTHTDACSTCFASYEWRRLRAAPTMPRCSSSPVPIQQGVRLDLEAVPEDLHPNQFFESILAERSSGCQFPSVRRRASCTAGVNCPQPK